MKLARWFARRSPLQVLLLAMLWPVGWVLVLAAIVFVDTLPWEHGAPAGIAIAPIAGTWWPMIIFFCAPSIGVVALWLGVQRLNRG